MGERLDSQWTAARFIWGCFPPFFLTCIFISFFEPAYQFWIYLTLFCYSYTMGAHCVPFATLFKTFCTVLHLDYQASVHPSFCAASVAENEDEQALQA